DRHAPRIAGILAPFATTTAIKSNAVEDTGVDVQVRIHLGGVSDRLLAMRADAAHEPLGTGKDHRRGNQEWGDAHVIEARDGARGIITVHRAEHLVAGQGRFDGDFGGFGIANFPDHDDVGVLAENRTEGIGESKANFLFGGHLVDARGLEFDRVFDGDDVVNWTVQLVQRGIEGGRFRRAGRAGDQDQAVRRVDRAFELGEGVGVQPELVDAGREVGLVEHAEYDLFSVDGRHDRDTEIVIFAANADAHAAVLGQA